MIWSIACLFNVFYWQINNPTNIFQSKNQKSNLTTFKLLLWLLRILFVYQSAALCYRTKTNSIQQRNNKTKTLTFPTLEMSSDLFKQQVTKWRRSSFCRKEWNGLKTFILWQNEYAPTIISGISVFEVMTCIENIFAFLWALIITVLLQSSESALWGWECSAAAPGATWQSVLGSAAGPAWSVRPGKRNIGCSLVILHYGNCTSCYKIDGLFSCLVPSSSILSTGETRMLLWALVIDTFIISRTIATGL